MNIVPYSIQALMDMTSNPQVIFPDLTASTGYIDIGKVANNLRRESILPARCLDSLTYNVNPIALSRTC